MDLLAENPGLSLEEVREQAEEGVDDEDVPAELAGKVAIY